MLPTAIATRGLIAPEGAVLQRSMFGDFTDGPYVASDDDLLAIFWPEGEAPAHIQRATEVELARFAAESLFRYPSLTLRLAQTQRQSVE